MSPHLKIGTALVEITDRAMRQARDNLEPLYEFVAEQSRAGVVAGADYRPQLLAVLSGIDSDWHAHLLVSNRRPDSVRLFRGLEDGMFSGATTIVIGGNWC